MSQHFLNGVHPQMRACARRHTGSKVPAVLKDMIRCYRQRWELQNTYKLDRWIKENPEKNEKANKIAQLLEEYNYDTKKLCEDFANVKSKTVRK